MLIDKLLFSDRAPSLLKKSLDMQAQRSLLVANNISNMDTPGFKAQDIDFRSQLQAALGTDSNFKLAKTHPKHGGPSRDSIKSLKELNS